MAKEKSMFKPDARPVWESPDGLQAFRMEDLDPEYAPELIRLKEEAELKMRNIKPLGLLEYAVSDEPLPQGADALLLRDRTGARNSTIIVSRGSATDRLLVIARFVLFQHLHKQPEYSGPKSILVWADGTVEMDGTVTKVGSISANNAGEAEALLKEKGKIIHLEGVGKVRAVRGQ